MYMQRKSMVRAKNTRNKHVFAQVTPICHARCSYNNVELRTPIFPNRSDTFMFLITMTCCGARYTGDNIFSI